MLYLNDEKDEGYTAGCKTRGLKEKFAWENILSYLVLITEEEDAKTELGGALRTEVSGKERIAPVQPKKEKRKESKVVKAKLPKPKTGETGDGETARASKRHSGTDRDRERFSRNASGAGENAGNTEQFYQSRTAQRGKIAPVQCRNLWRLWKNLWIIRSRWKKMRETQKREPIQNRWISPKKNRIRLGSRWEYMKTMESLQDGTVHGSIRERDASHDAEFSRVLEEMVRSRGG